MKVKDHFRISKYLNFQKLLTPNMINSISLRFERLASKYIEKYEEFKPSVKLNNYLNNTKIKRAELENITGLNCESSDIIDLENSFGNYFRDSDGNMILDCHMSNGYNVLGYNHRNMLRETRLEHYMPYSIGNSSIYGDVPSIEYAETVLKELHSLAPVNVEEIILSKSSDKAIEDAVRLCCISFIERYNHIIEQNKEFKVLTFQGADYDFNNNSIKLNFPDIKYPYESNLEHNYKAEEEAIIKFDGIISELKEKDILIPAIVIEPMHYNSGIKYAGPSFYRKIMKISKEADIKIIINESNTCGWMSGRTFSYLHWCSEISPDLVVFGGRMQLNGIFYRRDLINSDNFNEFKFTVKSQPDMLSYKKLMLLKYMVYSVDWLDLINTNFYSSLKTEFNEIKKYSYINILNERGMGKVFAFDVDHKLLRDEIIHLAKLKGIKLNALGDNTIALTPSLMFTEIHFNFVKQFLIECKPSTKYISKF